MKKIIMITGLLTAGALTAAGQGRGSPRPLLLLPATGAMGSSSAAAAAAAPAAAPSAPSASPLRQNSSSCAEPAGQEKEELKQALELVKTADSRGAVLAKLLATRPDLRATGEQLKTERESLPAAFKTRLLTAREVAAKGSFGRALGFARRVSQEFGFKDQFLIFYQSEKPLLATWKKHFILVSSTAVELLSEAEMAGQIAHETAHLFYSDELKKALEKNDFRSARIIELKCDLIAMMMLERLKLDPQALPAGLAVMSDWLAAHDQIKPAPTHPGLCARVKLAEEYARRFNQAGQLPLSGGAPGAAVHFPRLPESEATLYLQARIYYGDGDESVTFLPHRQFWLLDESLVQILKEHNFTLDEEPIAPAPQNRGLPEPRQPVGKPVRKEGRPTGGKESGARLNRSAAAAALLERDQVMADEERYLTAAVHLLEDDGGEENAQQEEETGAAAVAAGSKAAPASSARGAQSNEERALLLMLFEAALSGHRQAAGETNEWGMGVFAHLKPGRYYLFGFTRTERGETLVWHLPLELSAGNNELELDQYNSANIFEN